MMLASTAPGFGADYERHSSLDVAFTNKRGDVSTDLSSPTRSWLVKKYAVRDPDRASSTSAFKRESALRVWLRDVEQNIVAVL